MQGRLCSSLTPWRQQVQRCLGSLNPLSAIGNLKKKIMKKSDVNIHNCVLCLNAPSSRHHTCVYYLATSPWIILQYSKRGGVRLQKTCCSTWQPDACGWLSVSVGSASLVFSRRPWGQQHTTSTARVGVMSSGVEPAGELTRKLLVVFTAGAHQIFFRTWAPPMRLMDLLSCSRIFLPVAAESRHHRSPAVPLASSFVLQRAMMRCSIYPLCLPVMHSAPYL